MKTKLKPFLVLFSLIIYLFFAFASSLPESCMLRDLYVWIQGSNSAFGYSNFYWVLSQLTMIIIHQSSIGPDSKINYFMLVILCSLLITMTTMAFLVSMVDDYSLRIPTLIHWHYHDQQHLHE